MNKQISKRQVQQEEGGFILILTMLIVSITLAISFSIYTIAIKEVVLGSYMRESEKAFLAADRAIECALFWDRARPPQSSALRYTPFPTSTAWTNTSISALLPTVTCNLGGGNVRLDSLWTLHIAETATESRTTFNLTFTDGTYAEVEVFKSGINTIITSNGFNTPNVANTRRTQRTIVARYNL